MKQRRKVLAVGVAATLIVIGLVYRESWFGTQSTPATSPTASTPGTSSEVSPAAVALIAAGAPSLSGWKLTLPVDKAGSPSGTAEQLQAAAITTPWLVRNRDGSLSFWAPAVGARTSDSEHARTELVSTHDFTLGDGAHTLAATLSVTQVPNTDHDIDVGQIHGGGALSSIPFVMVHWRDRNIVVIIKQVIHGSTSQSVTLLTGVPLGARFSYVIADQGNGILALTAIYNGQARQATAQIATAFLDTDERFQVGDYQQATTRTSPRAGGGRVTFYAIDVT